MVKGTWEEMANRGLEGSTESINKGVFLGFRR